MDEPPKILDYATARSVPRAPVRTIVFWLLLSLWLIAGGTVFAYVAIDSVRRQLSWNGDLNSRGELAFYVLVAAIYLLVGGLCMRVAVCRIWRMLRGAMR